MPTYTLDLAGYIQTLPIEDRNAAIGTHRFDYEISRCSFCDCRPWGSWAQLPCGTRPGHGLPDHIAPWAGPLNLFD